MSNIYDVTIVGAGPAGCSVAYYLYQQGIKNILLVDKNVFPRDKLCAGALSVEAQECLDEMGILDQVRKQAYDVFRIYYITPYGSILKGKEIKEPKPIMRVLRRNVFDQILLENIKSTKVTVREGTQIKSLWKENSKICGITSNEGENIRSKVIVIATGANSLRFTHKKRFCYEAIGYMGWFEGTSFEKNIAYMIYDKDFLPFYGWMYPEADNMVNIGVGFEGSNYNLDRAKKCFGKIISIYLKPYMKQAKLVGFKRGFPLRYTYHVQDIVNENVLYVGEAGKIVDPLFGEGLSQAMVSGKFAAHSILNYLNTNEQEKLANYESMVKKKYYIFPWLRYVKTFINHKICWRIIEVFQGKEGRLNNKSI